jgi:hypothetical protein
VAGRQNGRMVVLLLWLVNENEVVLD